MKIVIIGAKERNTPEDRQAVNALIEMAAVAYPGCVLITMLTHEGVGLFVKAKCLEGAPDFKYQLVEISVRLYAKNLSKNEVSESYLARNASMFEVGDCFIYLASESRRGMIEELIPERVIPSGRPYRILLPGDKLELPI